jgi:hypothetical protein
MTRKRALWLVPFAWMATGIAVGRALPRSAPAAANQPPPSAPAPTAADAACQAMRAQLVTVKSQLGVCMAYAAPRAMPAPPPASPAEQESIDGILAELPAIHARTEHARELVMVQYRDGRVRSYLPDEWPPAGGLDGGRVTRRKLPDGTWEEYDPTPQIVQMAGPPGPDGLVTLPDGMRIRWVFTDAGAP